MKTLSLVLTGCLALGLSTTATAGSLQKHDTGSYGTVPASPDFGGANVVSDNFRAKYRLEKGLVQFEAGNFDAATKQFKKAHRWAAKHPVTNLMLGASLYKQGNMQEARGFLEASLKSGRYVLVGKLRQTAEGMLKEVKTAG
mgnify:FL=1